jgi:hypothetical protein
MTKPLRQKKRNRLQVRHSKSETAQNVRILSTDGEQRPKRQFLVHDGNNFAITSQQNLGGKLDVAVTAVLCVARL